MSDHQSMSASTLCKSTPSLGGGMPHGLVSCVSVLLLGLGSEKPVSWCCSHPCEHGRMVTVTRKEVHCNYQFPRYSSSRSGFKMVPNHSNLGLGKSWVYSVVDSHAMAILPCEL